MQKSRQRRTHPGKTTPGHLYHSRTWLRKPCPPHTTEERSLGGRFGIGWVGGDIVSPGLHFYQQGGVWYADFVASSNFAGIINLTLGDGRLEYAAILHKVPILALALNNDHAELVRKHLVKRIFDKMRSKDNPCWLHEPHLAALIEQLRPTERHRNQKKERSKKKTKTNTNQKRKLSAAVARRSSTTRIHWARVANI